MIQLRYNNNMDTILIIDGENFRKKIASVFIRDSEVLEFYRDIKE